MTQYDTLLKAIQDARVFKRNKIPVETKVLACLLYMAGLSYRCMTLQTGIIPACYRSVHYWVHGLKGITSRVEKKARRQGAIDETKQKVNGRQFFVWSAVDVETTELLAIHASYQRSSINALIFVKAVKSWARFNGLRLDDRVNVQDSEPQYAEEVIPRLDELQTFLDHCDTRVKVAGARQTWDPVSDTALVVDLDLQLNEGLSHGLPWSPI